MGGDSSSAGDSSSEKKAKPAPTYRSSAPATSARPVTRPNSRPRPTVAQNLASMPGALAEDIKIGLGQMEPTQGYYERTAARKAFEADQAASYGGDNNPQPRRSTMARAAAPSYGVGGVGSAPDLPDPDAVGETEQALLDAQSRGRSSTIATSAKGLLAGEDSTRKKRSLMGGLIR
jgi:hypothetical protein